MTPSGPQPNRPHALTVSTPRSNRLIARPRSGTFLHATDVVIAFAASLSRAAELRVRLAALRDMKANSNNLTLLNGAAA